MSGRWLAGLVGIAVLGWFAFVRGSRVPLLSLADLGFHELGHLYARSFGEVIYFMWGSVNQVLAPLAISAYFVWRRRDLLAGAVCLAWAATNFQDASVYIGDAPYQRLQLIGGEHDWATVLGPDHLNHLAAAHTIAAWVKAAGAVALLVAFVACALGWAHALGQTSRPSARPGWPRSGSHAERR